MGFNFKVKDVFYDQDGKLVLIQVPNLAGTLTILFLLVGWRSLAAIAGLYWCYLEIRYGINYFRRGLGVVVLIMIIMDIIRSIQR